jgi:hypothetical protein
VGLGPGELVFGGRALAPRRGAEGEGEDPGPLCAALASVRGDAVVHVCPFTHQVRRRAEFPGLGLILTMIAQDGREPGRVVRHRFAFAGITCPCVPAL